VERECLFHATTVCYTSYGKCFGDAAVTLSDNGSFEKLDSFSLSFLDSVVNSYGITNIERRHFCLELLVCKSLDDNVLAHWVFLLDFSDIHAQLVQRTVRNYITAWL
jgi:hypothetical protein